MKSFDSSTAQLVCCFLVAGCALAVAAPAAGVGHKHPACACAHCGCMCPCRKVCRLECIDKATPVTIWGLKCEEFCIGDPSCEKCCNCRMLCDQDAKDAPCRAPKKFVWSTWLPSCQATMFTRKKLLKQVATVNTKSYKWVVEDLCPECTAACRPASYPAGTKLPPKPSLVDAVVLVGTPHLIGVEASPSPR